MSVVGITHWKFLLYFFLAFFVLKKTSVKTFFDNI